MKATLLAVSCLFVSPSMAQEAPDQSDPKVIRRVSDPIATTAVSGQLVDSPLDGVVEIDVQGGGIERHCLNAAQIVRVYTKEFPSESGSAAVVIGTTETGFVARENGAGSRSVAYYLRYGTRPEADKAAKTILKELSVALGVRGPLQRTRIIGPSSNRALKKKAEQDGGGQPATRPESK